MKTLMVPTQRSNSTKADNLPFGMAHPNDTPCPFANDELPYEYLNTCCSFSMRDATETLAAMGKVGLEDLLHKALLVEDLPTIVDELRRTADWFESRYVEPADAGDHVQQGGVTNLVTGDPISWSRSRFEEALASLRKAADWYEKVGALGFDVEVWY